jgi:hypothetical protein
MAITDHSRQLDRVADDMVFVCRGSFGYGILRATNIVLFPIEALLFGLSLFHLAHGGTGLAFFEACLGIFVIVVHTGALFGERWMHHSHGGFADRLRDELRGKAKILRSDAEKENLELR